MSSQDSAVIYGTEDILRSLCNSVTKVLTIATQSQIHYSGMVQRISKTCLKPDIGCFVLFDGGFSGLVVINFSASAAMELYESYMLHMGMAKGELATTHTASVSGPRPSAVSATMRSGTTRICLRRPPGSSPRPAPGLTT